MSSPWREKGVKIDHNLYWRAIPGPLPVIAGQTLEAWQQETALNLRENGITADHGPANSRRST